MKLSNKKNEVEYGRIQGGRKIRDINASLHILEGRAWKTKGNGTGMKGQLTDRLLIPGVDRSMRGDVGHPIETIVYKLAGARGSAPKGRGPNRLKGSTLQTRNGKKRTELGALHQK